MLRLTAAKDVARTAITLAHFSFSDVRHSAKRFCDSLNVCGDNTRGSTENTGMQSETV